jgi:hypothetical protein
VELQVRVVHRVLQAQVELLVLQVQVEPQEQVVLQEQAVLMEIQETSINGDIVMEVQLPPRKLFNQTLVQEISVLV